MTVGDERLPTDARASLVVLAAQLQALQTLIGSIEKGVTDRAMEAWYRLPLQTPNRRVRWQATSDDENS